MEISHDIQEAAGAGLAFSVPLWAWIAFAGFVVAMLALDLGVVHRRDKAIPLRDAAMWSAIWVALAAVACMLTGIWHGRAVAELFATGYLLELSLSVDNLFVFLMIFSHFAVPEEYRHRALFWGIIGAVLFRVLFIVCGVELIQKFSWLIYIFSALLLYSGIKMFFREKEKIDFSKSKMMKLAGKTNRLTHGYRGHSFFAIENHRLCFTPLLLVVCIIEASDVVFAFDSVPAVIGVIPKNASSEVAMFIAITSNIFAILGLRSFFFVISEFMNSMRFVRFGLGVILVFVAVKFFCEETGWWHASTKFSLLFLLVVLIMSAMLSRAFPKKQKEDKEP